MSGLNFAHCDDNVLSNIGLRQDLRIKQGSTFLIRGVLRNPITYIDEVAQPQTFVDLTGCTFVAKIRKKALDVAVIAAFSFSIIDAENGVYELVLTDEVTATIPCGERMTDDASKYVWDAELHDTAGQVIPLWYGDVVVFRNASHA